MTPETKKKCEEAMALVKKGMTQQEALKKLGIGTATISRYKADLKRSTTNPIPPYDSKPKASLKVSKAKETHAKQKQLAMVNAINIDPQISIYEKEIKKLKVVNGKLNEIIATLIT